MEQRSNFEQQYIAPQEGLFEAEELVSRQAVEARAWQLLQNRDQFDKVEIGQQEYTDNARTALMEALTASGHLSLVRLNGTIEEINAQVLTRLLNGWDDTLPFHEKQRRFAELCNELVIQETHKAIVAGDLPISTRVLEISDYITGVSETVASELGYRSENKKGMVRSTGLVANNDGTYTRVIEQISRSNATGGSTSSLFEASGITVDWGDNHDVQALSRPLLYSTAQYANGVIDIQRRLDKYAGGVLYGEYTSPMHVPYEELRQESAVREARIEFYIDKLANYEKRLDQQLELGKITVGQKDTQYKHQVRSILEAICTLAPEYAEDCFGQEVVEIFMQASNYAAMGQHDLAQQIIMDNRNLQKTITFCGVSISADKAKELGIEISETGELISEGKENMSFKPGVCRIKSCGKKTEVGPCSICRKCQDRFDKGEDPTKDVVRLEKKQPKAVKTKGIFEILGVAA